ncbi:MAG TPA: YfiR family protein [Niastella sp.]
MKNYQELPVKKRSIHSRGHLQKVVLLFYFIICSYIPNRQIDKASEYNLKAAFIYNFTKFIEWKMISTDNEFVIGIIGASPIYDPLAEVIKTETVDGKKIIIKQFNKAADISDCHILFISRSAGSALEDILAKTTGKGMLIVSEQDGYAKSGTALNFVIVNRKLKFEANVKAINAAGLAASSQLLKLAIIVK